MSGDQGLMVVSLRSVSQKKYLRVHDSTGELTPDAEKPGADTALIFAWVAREDFKYVAFRSVTRDMWLEVNTHSNNRVTATAAFQKDHPSAAFSLFTLHPVGGADFLTPDGIDQDESNVFGIIDHYTGSPSTAWGLNSDDDYKVYGDRSAAKIDTHDHLQFEMVYASPAVLGGPFSNLKTGA